MHMKKWYNGINGNHKLECIANGGRNCISYNLSLSWNSSYVAEGSFTLMWHIMKIDILFTDAQTVLSAAQTFGAGSTPYMVSRVNCSGSEELLAECSHLGVNVHNCRKSQEAGVRCGKNMLPYTLPT